MKYFLFLAWCLFLPYGTISAEVILSFWLESCMKKSELIGKATILNTKGDIQFNTIYHGKNLAPSGLNVARLSSPHQLYDPGYAPADTVVGQELILFLHRDEQGNWIPAIQHEEYDPWALLETTLVWVIDDFIWYGEQFENPGSLVFAKRGSLEKLESQIQLYLRSAEVLKRAETITDFSTRVELLKDALDWTDISRSDPGSTRSIRCSRCRVFTSPIASGHGTLYLCPFPYP